MKLENQVCSQEHGKALAKLGIDPLLCNLVWKGGEIVHPSELDIDDCVSTFDAPAFTSAELGVMHGVGTKATENLYNAVLVKLNSGNSFSIVFNPDLLAEHLIFSLQENYITAKDCNKRLSK